MVEATRTLHFGGHTTTGVIVLLTILIAYVLTATENQEADGPDQQGGHQQALTLLSRMKESRDRLRNGAYRASGRLVKVDQRSGEKVEGKVEVFSAFDFDRGLMRFDRTEPIIRHIDEQSIPGELMVKVIRTPEFTANWMNSWKFGNIMTHTAVGIRAAGHKFTDPFNWFRTIDVRSLGLDLWKAKFQEGAPFEEAYGAWVASRRIEVSPEEHGVYRLRLRQGRSGTYVPQSLWIDEKQGFSPIRLTYVMPGENPGPPILEGKASWQLVAGAWVPATYHLEARDPHSVDTELDLKFDWSSVNAAVKPELFTAEGLDVPAGTSIIDYRPVQPVRVGTIAGDRPRPEKREYIGIGIAFDCKERTKVTGLVPNGPAERDGRLKVGDVILGIEKEIGEAVEFKDEASVAELLKGAAGTQVRIIVIPEGTNKREVYELTRQVIHAPYSNENPPSESPR